MDSSPAKALPDTLTSGQKKEMTAIATGWLANRHPEDDNVPMEDATNEDPVPPSLVHYNMTVGEARTHYMDMLREEWEEQF